MSELFITMFHAVDSKSRACVIFEIMQMNFFMKTSQVLQILSSVPIDCQVTKIVDNPGSQLSVFSVSNVTSPYDPSFKLFSNECVSKMSFFPKRKVQPSTYPSRVYMNQIQKYFSLTQL